MIDIFKKKKQWCLIMADGTYTNPSLITTMFQLDYRKSWMTFSEALEHRGEYTLGFLLNNDYMCITLDKCYDENKCLKEWAENFIVALRGLAYIEKYYESINIVILCNEIHKKTKLSIKLNETHKLYREGKGSISINTHRHAVPMNGDILDGYDIPRIDSMYFTDLLLFMTNITNGRNNIKEIIKSPERVGTSNDILFEQVKKTVTIEQILIHYGIASEGNRIVCPLCKFEKRSFHIFSMIDAWYCFECHRGGDQIDFVRYKANLTEYHAAAKIAHWFNMEVDPNILLFKSAEHRTVLAACKKINISRRGDPDMALRSRENGIDLNNFGMDQEWGSGIFLTHAGIVKRYKYQKRGKDLCYKDILLSPLIIYPKRIIRVNRIEELELCCVTRDGYRVSATTKLIDNKDMSSVTAWRILVNSIVKPMYWAGNMDDLNLFIEYLIKLVDKLDIEKVEAVDKFGWDGDELLPYDKHVFIRDPNLLIIQDAFGMRGNYELWLEKIKSLRSNHSFNLILMTALASLDKVGPKFWLHSMCEWSGGKSAALKAVASAFGDPIKLTRSFNVTDNGVEFFANVMNNLPVFFDDIQSLPGSVERERMLYNAISGVGKTRATASGELPIMHSWRCNFISNGEEGFLPRNVKEGAHKRIIEYNDVPIPNIIQAEEAHEFFEANFGFLAPKIAKIYVKRYGMMKDLYKKLHDLVTSSLPISCMPEHLKNIVICGKWNYLFEIEILGTNVDEALNSTLDWMKNIIVNLISGGEVNTFNSAIDYIKAFFVQNLNRFKPTAIEQYGFVENTTIGQVLYIFPNVFRELLRTCRIEERRFVKESKKLGIMVIDNQGSTPLRYYKGTRQRIPGIYIDRFMTEMDINNSFGRILGEAEKVGH